MSPMNFRYLNTLQTYLDSLKEETRGPWMRDIYIYFEFICSDVRHKTN